MGKAIGIAGVLVLIALTGQATEHWDTIQKESSKMVLAVMGAVQQVKTLAKEDNPSAATEIEKKLKAAGVHFTGIVGQAYVHINDKTYTKAEASKHFPQLKQIILDARKDTKVDVEKLSPGAQQKIHDLFQSCYANVEKSLDEMMKLLP